MPNKLQSIVMSNISLTTTSQRNSTGDPADETPENEVLGMQSCTAAEAFVQGLAGLVNQNDVETMIKAQKQMLQRFEKTNEMLLNYNALSQSRLKGANEDFRKHVKLLTEMKKDLDYIFRKIRVIKHKLSQQYPAAYADAQPQRSSLAEEAEDESELAIGLSAAITPGPTNSSTDEVPPLVEATHRPSTTVEYVQMEEAVDNGKPIENELIKRVCSIETANPNDSSDCTSEDTG